MSKEHKCKCQQVTLVKKKLASLNILRGELHRNTQPNGADHSRIGDFMKNWELQGYADHPHRYNYPQPGTNDETQYLNGWLRADRENQQSSDMEWPLGRETYFASYSEKNNLT